MLERINEVPMRLISGSGLKKVTLVFGKVKKINRTFSTDKITYVPSNCVKAALGSKIIEEVKDQNAN